MRTRPVRRILVANRGEVARRIFRTCRDLGVSTAAVYADPDRDSLHAREADVAVPLHGTTSAETYLDAGKLVAAARRAGADAVHPGFGFLAENAHFAAACIDAGLLWIGPRPAAMAAMANKVDAKDRMAASGVPLLPSATIVDDDPGDWERAAAGVGYPLLVKAAAGGGGKGMREVVDPAALRDAVTAARREAASSFGDPLVFVERLLVAPRHVEVQVLGDEHGGLVHLFERDCSLQRRHQKVVEEARAPGLTDALRQRLYDAALAAARAVDYTNAGTVEFLVAGDDLYFLEMNTRLQVEHPVTEEITGLDIVRLQIEIARGGTLPLSQDAIRARGHAIEVRLYAEDPAHDHLPSSGTVHRFSYEDVPGVRWDTGVASGRAVPPYFDPMLGKVIAHGATRDEAARRLARALRDLHLHGITSNRDALVATLEHDAFLDGEVATDFFTRHPETLSAAPPADVRRVHAAAAVIGRRMRDRAASPLAPVAPAGWRSLPGAPRVADVIDVGDSTVHVVAGPLGPTARLPLVVDGEEVDCVVVSGDGERIDLEIAGLRSTYHVAAADGRVFVNGLGWQSELVEHSRHHDRATGAHDAGPVAPVPGQVVAVAAQIGVAVAAGDVLVVLEAMKMEHRVTADVDGVVTAVHVAVGDAVDAHQLLVEVEPLPGGGG